MTYEFTKLSEVETIETINCNTNVLIEEDGEIKKINKTSLIENKHEYVPVHSLSEIDPQGTYIIITAGSDNKGITNDIFKNGCVMMPTVAVLSNGTSTRQGFLLVNTEVLAFSNVVVFDEVEGKLISTTDKYDWFIAKIDDSDEVVLYSYSGIARINKSEVYGLVCDFNASANSFYITEYESGVFEFSQGDYFLDINNRGVVNGYETNYHSRFRLFKKV